MEQSGVELSRLEKSGVEKRRDERKERRAQIRVERK